jgi:hypothetical protein
MDRQCPLWAVKFGNTRCEQMFSALPPETRQSLDAVGMSESATSGHSVDQGTRTSDFATFRAQAINDPTAGPRVRFFKNTISAVIRGPKDFNGSTFKA